MSKKPFCIGEIATSHDGYLCATADLDNNIWVWDLHDGSLVSMFPSCYSSGGSRLAIAPDGSLCIAGDYQTKGIEAYRVSDGSVLWRRRDLKQVQHLSYDMKCGLWVACFDETPCHLLDRETGKTIETIPKVVGRTVSPYDDVVLVEKPGKAGCELCDGAAQTMIAAIEKYTAALSVAFGPGCAFVSQAAGSLGAFSTEDGRLLWEYDPGKTKHFLSVSYGRTAEAVFGVVWAFKGEGDDDVLVSFDVATGKVLQGVVLGTYSTVEFALGGDALVTSQGEVFDLTAAKPRLHLRLKTPAVIG